MGYQKETREQEFHLFPSSSLRFFDLGVSWDKGSFFKLFTRAYLSLLYLVAISSRLRKDLIEAMD